MWERLADKAWRDGYAAGVEQGRAQGRAEAEAEQAASWAAISAPIAHPERYASQRLAAALAGERRDAAEHERAFVARAWNTPDAQRTDTQRGTVHVYPPPDWPKGRTR